MVTNLLGKVVRKQIVSLKRFDFYVAIHNAYDGCIYKWLYFLVSIRLLFVASRFIKKPLSRNLALPNLIVTILQGHYLFINFLLGHELNFLICACMYVFVCVNVIYISLSNTSWHDININKST